MKCFVVVAASKVLVTLLCVGAHANGPGTVYNVPPDPVPAALLPGDILTYDPGPSPYSVFPPIISGSTVNLLSGEIDISGHVNGTLNVFGGRAAAVLARDTSMTIGGGTVALLDLQHSTLVMSEGVITDHLGLKDSTVFLSGGVVKILGGVDGSTINMTGGAIEYSFGSVYGNGTLNVSGGVVGGIRLGDGVQFNMSGGALVSDFTAEPSSQVHLTVRDAQLNGQAIPGLSAGVTVPVDVTGLLGQLVGTFADGSPFRIDLSSEGYSDVPQFPVIVTDPAFSSSTSQISTIEVLITRVPEPSSSVLLLCGVAAFTCCARCYRTTSLGCWLRKS